MPQVSLPKLSWPRISVNALLLYGLIALLVLAPLPFGSNRPWASSLMALWCGSLLGLLAWQRYRAPRFWPESAPTKLLNMAVLLYGGAITWGALQTQSWLPAAWHHPLWQNVASFQTVPFGAVSLAPSQYGECALRMLTYAGIFLLALFLGRDMQQAKLILKALVFASAAYALYGLVVQASGGQTILFYSKWAYLEFLTSTFVNKNSYATYAGLGLIGAMGLFWNRLKHQPRQASQHFSRQSLMVRKLAKQDSLYLILIVLLAGALVLTSSRAGIFSAMTGCLFFIILLAVNRRWRFVHWLPVLLGCAALLILLVAFSGNLLLERLESEQIDADSMARLNLYTATIESITSRPILGYGLGSFQDTLRLFMEQPVWKWFDHAHNDYLELILELGLPAATLLIVAVVILIIRCLTAVRQRRHMEIFPIMAVATSLTIGLHSLFDFSLQIPAISATYAALLGLGVAQSWPQKKMEILIHSKGTILCSM